MPAVNNNIQLSDATEQFKNLLKKAVNKYLIADVEVGTFLSGGLDSSTIVYLASQINPNIKSYSYGFRGERSELKFAQATAKKCKVTCQELIEDEEYDIADLLLKMQSVYDEPFADSSNIPTYLICGLARKYGKVVLTGDGADELLGGYSWHSAIQSVMHESSTSMMQLPLIYALVAGEKVFEMMLHYSGVGVSQKRYWRQRYLNLKMCNKVKNYYEANQKFRSSNLHAELINNSERIESYRQSPSWNLTHSMEDVFRSDIEQYMCADILVKIDRASMAHGLELRAPFLDIDFASFCLSLPEQYKINSHSNKIILREAFSSAWTEEIRQRPKQGFDAPIGDWLSMDSVSKLKNDHFNNPNHRIYNILSRENTSKYLENNDVITWRLLILALWVDKNSFSLN
jgi:asparagine synthase (glutamine-hydrolysing)